MVVFETRSASVLQYVSTGSAEAGHSQTGFTENPYRDMEMAWPPEIVPM